MASNSRTGYVSAGTFFTVATFALVVAILYVARSIILPVAMAVLLTALLAPLVRRLEHWRLHRVAAVILVVTVIAIGLLGAVAIFGQQAVSLSAEISKYREEIREKFMGLKRIVRASPEMEESMEMLENLPDAAMEAPVDEAEALSPTPAPPGAIQDSPAPQRGEASTPVPVRVVPDETSIFSGASQWMAVIMEPIGVAAIVVVLTVFMLIAREDLRNRMLVLFGGDSVPGTTQLLEEAWQRVSRYLRMQLLINAMYGVAVFGVTLFAGLPNAPIFGLQAMLLRFVPYLGPVLAAGLPLAVTLAVTPGWQTLIIVAVCLLVLELVVNNVLEPWLYGSSTGVSTVGILMSAFFWSWLWGPVGLVLATPLTVCLVVLGKHVPALKFWATLLSEESPLGPMERLNQRLLARDTFEAHRIIEAGQKEEPSAAVAIACNMMAGAVTRAAIDHSAGELEDERLESFAAAFDHVWQEVLDDLELPNPEHLKQAGGLRALCIPARGVCDSQVARIVSTFLTNEGWAARAMESRLLARDVAVQVKDGEVDVCVVTALGERAAAHARYVCRSLTMHGWHGPIAVLVMPGEHLTATDLERLAHVGANEVVKSQAELALKLPALTQRARIEREGEPAEGSDVPVVIAPVV
jgi:predicted PurR-regulated permease PerM